MGDDFLGLVKRQSDGQHLANSLQGIPVSRLSVWNLQDRSEKIVFEGEIPWLFPRSVAAGDTLLASDWMESAIAGFEIGGQERASPTLLFEQSGYLVCCPSLSPDGEWVAFTTTETGRQEVYLARYPLGTGKTPVSRGGGSNPLWSPNGAELFYQGSQGENLWVVDVSRDSELRVGTPRIWAEGFFVDGDDAGQTYDVSADGERVLMLQLPSRFRDFSEIRVVLNWFEELQERVPTGG